MKDMKLYRYINDIWIGETSPEKVGKAEGEINKAEIDIPSRKCHRPNTVILLGIWWIAGSAVIPSDILWKIREM